MHVRPMDSSVPGSGILLDQGVWLHTILLRHHYRAVAFATKKNIQYAGEILSCSPNLSADSEMVYS